MNVAKIIEDMSFQQIKDGDYEKKFFEEFSLRLLCERDSVLVALSAPKFSAFLDAIFSKREGYANLYAKRKLQGGVVIGQEYFSFDPVEGLEDHLYEMVINLISNYLDVGDWESFSKACFLNPSKVRLHIFDNSWFAMYLFCRRGLTAEDIFQEFQHYKSVGATRGWRLSQDWEGELINYALQVFKAQHYLTPNLVSS